jgi:hypothetical protein
MVAVDIRLTHTGAMTRSVAALRRLDPKAAAREVATLGDDAWTQQFLAALSQEVRPDPLERLMGAWALSAAATGRMFGVSRQAVAKWRTHGVPEERLVAVADLEAATDVLERYVRVERIPAIVRRPATILGNRSLLDLAMAGRFEEVRRGAAHMLDLRRVQP